MMHRHQNIKSRDSTLYVERVSKELTVQLSRRIHDGTVCHRGFQELILANIECIFDTLRYCAV
jgi:hypothetical protein